MPFEPKRFDQIVADMRARTPAELSDFSVGSVARTIYESFAYELAMLYEQMHGVYLSAFVDTATGQQLDMVVALLGVSRGQPDYVSGEVSFQRDLGNEEILIPAGTLVATEETAERRRRVYQTSEPRTLARDSAELAVRVQAVERGEDEATAAGSVTVMPRPIPGVKAVINREALRFAGKRREGDEELRSRAKQALIASGKATALAIENALLSQPGVTDVRVHEHLEDEAQQLRGVVDVYVDAEGFATADERHARTKARLQAAVDRVRAAGVLVRLYPVTPVQIEAVFKIEINRTRWPDAADRARIEAEVSEAVLAYLRSLRMGQPLQPPQLIRSILALSQVENLANYIITARPPGEEAQIFTLEKNAVAPITVTQFQRITPAFVLVAADVKPLPVDVLIKFAPLSADPQVRAERWDALMRALSSYFNTLKVGEAARPDSAGILGVLGPIGAAESLTLTPRPWLPGRPYTGGPVEASFVEQVRLGQVRAFDTTLVMSGAVRLTMAPGADRTAAINEVRAALQALVAQSPAGQPLALKDLEAHAKARGVEKAELNEADFRVSDGARDVTVGLLNAGKLDIGLFVRAQLPYLLVAVEPTAKVEVRFSGVSVSASATATASVPAGTPVTPIERVIGPEQPALNPDDAVDQAAATAATAVRDRIVAAIRAAVPNITKGLKAGDDVRYEELRRALEVQVPGISYNVDELALAARALGDGLVQVTPVGVLRNDIHIRSLERAELAAPEDAAIAVTVRVTVWREPAAR